MPKLSELFDVLRRDVESLGCNPDNNGMESQVLQELRELEALVTPVVKRYDFWRTAYCATGDLTEAAFDEMTDAAMGEQVASDGVPKLILPPLM